MRIPDVNVLVYAIDSSARHHQKAKRWLEDALSGGESLGFSWAVLGGTLRVTTHPTILENPLSADEGLDLIESVLSSAPAVSVEPTDRHLTILRSLLAEAGTAGNLVPDAHLAALAIERSATLASFDADFHRFPGLRFEYLGAPAG